MDGKKPIERQKHLQDWYTLFYKGINDTKGCFYSLCKLGSRGQAEWCVMPFYAPCALQHA